MPGWNLWRWCAVWRCILLFWTIWLPAVEGCNLWAHWFIMTAILPTFRTFCLSAYGRCLVALCGFYPCWLFWYGAVKGGNWLLTRKAQSRFGFWQSSFQPLWGICFWLHGLRLTVPTVILWFCSPLGQCTLVQSSGWPANTCWGVKDTALCWYSVWC